MREEMPDSDDRDHLEIAPVLGGKRCRRHGQDEFQFWIRGPSMAGRTVRRQFGSAAACNLDVPEQGRGQSSDAASLVRLRGSQAVKILRLPGPVGVGPADRKIIWMKVPA
jgi:hypothetical protein